MIKSTQAGTNLLLLLFLVVHTGCAIFAFGAGAAGGYAIGKDQVEGFSDESYDKVWKAAYQVFKEESMIETADKAHGKIEALIEKTEVKFELNQISPKSVRLRVRARKALNLFPDIKLAHKVYEEIMERL